MPYHAQIQQPVSVAKGFCLDYTIDRPGIGDYLIALNHALTISEWPDLPVVSTPNRLSERTGSSSIHSYLGLDKISGARRNQSTLMNEPRNQSELRVTLSGLYSLIEKLETPSACHDSLSQYDIVVCQMDRGDYKNLRHFSDVRKSLGIPQKSNILSKSLSESPASDHCTLELAKLNKEVLLIHVRRGDIAIADLNSLSREGLVEHNPGDDGKLIYALDGRLYTHMEILDSPHRYRYVDVEKYCLALNSFLHGKERNDYFIVLVSDGYDRLISRVIQSNGIRMLGSISDLDKYFSTELSDLTGVTDMSIIGESEDRLLETVSYIMMAKVIIHGPSSMAVNLKSCLGDGEQFTALCIS